MRMCVLGIMGEIVLRLLSLEDLDENSRDLRDEFLDHLEDHLHDIHAFVRVKVCTFFYIIHIYYVLIYRIGLYIV